MKSAETKNIELKVDKVRIIQVLTNLLTNAIKFTPKGGFVELMIEEESDEEGHIVINVRDNGKGIPEEIIKNLLTKM